MRYVLGPWIWETTGDIGPHWRSPDDCAGCLDLRSIPQQSVAGGAPEGFGLFALHNAAPNPGRDYRLIGTALDDTIGPAARNLIGSQLGVGALESPRLDLLLYELLTMKGDHTGDTFARPLMPNMARQIEIGLAGGRVHRERFRHDAIQHRAAIRQIREQYRANRLAESQGRLPRDHHRRILDFTRKKLGLDWRVLVPPEFIGDPGPLLHRTTITESFNQGDSTTLGPDLTWAEITGNLDTVSNEVNVVSTSTNSAARAETDLSSSDHYAELVITALSVSSTTAAGSCARFAAAATTYYVSNLENIGTDQLKIYKRITGTFTNLSITNYPIALPDTVRLTCDGSNIKDSVDTVEKNNITDTAIAGNTRAGVNLYRSSGTTAADSFEAADLAAGASVNLLQGKIGLPRQKIA